MGKRLMRLLTVLCSAALLPAMHAAAAEVAVEQVQCVMPEIQVYLRTDADLSKTELKAFLDTEALPQPKAEHFSASGEPIQYYVLLDNSGSVSQTYVAPIREAIAHLGETLRPQDSLRVYTVGETAAQIYDGSGKSAALTEALEQYTAREQETVLFEALVQCAKTAQADAGTEFVRRAVLLFSDGVNESVGVSVYDEAMTALQAAQLPVYGFGLGSDAAGLDSFGKLARQTGGTMQRIAPGETDEALQTAAESLLSDYYTVRLEADSNILGGSRELLLQVGSVSKTVTVVPERWIPDETAPEILSVEQTAEDLLKIMFSENVSGAETLSNYLLGYNFNGQTVPLASVRYVAEDGAYYAVLEPDAALYAGDYTLKLFHITDVSQEKNSLAEDTAEITMRGIQPGAATKAYYQNRYFWLILILVLLIVLVVCLLLLRRRQPAAEAAAAGTAAGEQQIHVRNPEGVPRTLKLIVRTANALPVEMQAVIGESMLLGRSKECKVYFDDPSMSRKHFLLTVRGTELWISDCGSTSGTKVNGIPLKEEQQLSQGDVIAAGLTEITVRW